MIRHRHVQLCLLVSFLFLSAACGPSDPATVVNNTRAEYKVQLNTFIVQEPEPEPELVLEVVEMEAAAGEAVAAAAEGVMEAAELVAEGEEGGEGEIDEVVVDEGPSSTDVLLDLYVLFNGKESLDGVTVDISMADPFEKEKGTFRRYLETGKMARGEGRQLSVVLEDIENFETGDVFSVFIRSYVPAEERGEYQEFAAAGS